MSFPAYPSYRDSNDEWLGDVPTHWDITRLKRTCEVFPSNVDKKTVEGQQSVRLCNYTDVYYNDEIHDGMPFMEASATDDQIERFELRAGDTIFTKDSETPDDIARSAYVPVDLPGVICGYHLSMARPNARTCGAFIKRYFDAPSTRAYFHVKANGLTRVGLGQYAVDNAPIALPPLPEQTAIVSFLDRETAKIDALVEEQRRLIGLLKEKRQAVISHAVTKGLDRAAPMKDSGLEWLGAVPAHWHLLPVRALFRFVKRQEGKALDVLSVYRDFGVIRKSDRDDNINKTPEDLSSYQTVTPGDLVINKMKAWQGSLGVAEMEGIISPDYAVFLALHDEDPRFFNHLFRCQLLPDVYRSISNGIRTDQWRLEPSRFKELIVPVPPVAEQLKIAAHVEREIGRMDRLVLEVTTATMLLQERRAALIAEAVTGKIDIRGSAKVLPFSIDRTRARGLVGTEIIERLAQQPTFGRVKLQKIAFLTEAHVGVGELAGSYTREAAGPLDRTMIDEMESGARHIAGVTVNQAGGIGTAVSYQLHRHRGSNREALADWLGEARTAKLDKLIADFSDLTTKSSEAVATLYGVWNDALIAGVSPTDGDIIAAFLNDWHPEKRQKFHADELARWLEWMRRHDIVPSGSGPKTTAGSLFS